MNSVAKQAFLAILLVSSFYIVIYIIIDLLVFENNSSSNEVVHNYFIEDKDQRIPKNTAIINNESNITISKEIQENINKINLIEQFNPKIQDDIEYQKNKKRIKKPKNITKRIKDKIKRDKEKLAKNIYKKPKMVIIIDDIVFGYQVKLIKSIDLNLTPSFIPSVSEKQAEKLRKSFNSYMIHLPLEAIGHKVEEKITLKTNASSSKIVNIVTKAKTMFPKANFLNNHTGSKFTSNTKAMEKLKNVLSIYNIKFVDSKTTKNSKAKKVFGKNLLSRNVFLDHFDDKKEIKKAIKKAIKIAKRDGFSIAIAHPRKSTIQALKDYKDILNKEVNVVYIDDL